jgi:hypothetical protein
LSPFSIASCIKSKRGLEKAAALKFSLVGTRYDV